MLGTVGTGTELLLNCPLGRRRFDPAGPLTSGVLYERLRCCAFADCEAMAGNDGLCGLRAIGRLEELVWPSLDGPLDIAGAVYLL